MVNYPFSASFFMQCFYRIMNRDDHETLSNKDPVLATSVLFMFFKFYFRESFTSSFLNDHDLDGFLEVPLTIEDTYLPIPNAIVELMEEILKQTSKGSKPQHEALVEDFMNLAMKHEKEVMGKIQGKFDQVDQEYTILD